MVRAEVMAVERRQGNGLPSQGYCDLAADEWVGGDVGLDRLQLHRQLRIVRRNAG